jgi:hypothetical protein
MNALLSKTQLKQTSTMSCMASDQSAHPKVLFGRQYDLIPQVENVSLLLTLQALHRYEECRAGASEDWDDESDRSLTFSDESQSGKGFSVRFDYSSFYRLQRLFRGGVGMVDLGSGKPWTHYVRNIESLRPYIEETSQIVDVLLTFMVYHRGDKILSLPHTRKSLIRTWVYWFSRMVTGDWNVWYKYHVNYLFCHAERSRKGGELIEYPSRPEGVEGRGVLFWGSLQRQLKNLLIRNTKSDHSRDARWDLLQGTKKGLPFLSLDSVIESAEKHKRLLSLERETPFEFLEKMRQKIVDSNVIESVVPFDRVIGGQVNSAACSEYTRANRGAQGYLWDQYTSTKWHGHKDNPFRMSYFEDVIFPTHLWSMGFHPLIGVWEERIHFDFSQVLREDVPLQVLEKPPSTKVKFILEPLKIRTITKAPAKMNAVWKPLQLQMWQQLQKFEAFTLTGRTVSEDIIRDIYLKSRSFEEKYPFTSGETYWVSGDYSAATDNLNTDVTLMIAEQFCKRHPEYYTIMRSALSANEISYEGSFGDPGKVDQLMPSSFVQSNGQLMGCIFSFPILCWANALVYWLALEEYHQKSFSFEELPVLVNGDDILFRGDSLFIGIWEEYISKVGFEKSVGKNFVSSNFLTINSRYYDCRKGIELVPAVNYGFLYGLVKGGGSGKKESSKATTKTEVFMDLQFVDYFRDVRTDEELGKFKQLLLRKVPAIGYSRRSQWAMGIPSILRFQYDYKRMAYMDPRLFPREFKQPSIFEVNLERVITSERSSGRLQSFDPRLISNYMLYQSKSEHNLSYKILLEDAGKKSQRKSDRVVRVGGKCETVDRKPKSGTAMYVGDSFKRAFRNAVQCVMESGGKGLGPLHMFVEKSTSILGTLPGGSTQCVSRLTPRDDGGIHDELMMAFQKLN